MKLESFELEPLSGANPWLDQALLSPLHSFLSRPHKGFRAGLVDLGFRLFATPDIRRKNGEISKRLQSVIETLHAGSLIVDDVQDQSEERRGQPCLHHQIGVPLAINAGNWLYFLALQKVTETPWPDSWRLRALTECTQILLRAHEGQALDLSVRMTDAEPQKIPSLCRQSLAGKSGALMELGLVLGALAAEASDPQLAAARRLGLELGVNLQMFDDLGNLNLERPQTKHLEDLMLGRPSFVWWVVAEHFPHCLEDFAASARALPDLAQLKKCLQQMPVHAEGRRLALAHQERLFADWNPDGAAFDAHVFDQIVSLSKRIAHAYN